MSMTMSGAADITSGRPIAGAARRATARRRSSIRRLVWLGAFGAAGFLIAGFWNVQFVDGLGLTVFVRPAIGDFEGRAAAFDELGPGFGFLFAVLAGLAATWTASNAATLTMLPLLAIAVEGRLKDAWKVAALTAVSAAAVGVVYGVFIGRLGPAGAAAFNASPIRSAQSLAVFGALGACLVVWALAEAGVLRAWLPVSPLTRAFFAQPGTKAVLCGLAIGAFSIGRPLAVFREVLLYAAQPALLSYGAAVVAVAVLGTVIIPLSLLLIVTAAFGERIKAAIAASARPQAIAACALAGGGVFLLSYWGFSRIWPALGRWGFTLGIYG